MELGHIYAKASSFVVLKTLGQYSATIVEKTVRKFKTNTLY